MEAVAAGVRFLLEGFMVGLSTGGYCLAGCVPILLPHYLADERNRRAGIGMLLEFLLGRLIAYAVFGIAFGFLGAKARQVFGGLPAGLALAATGALLLAGGLVRVFPQASPCRILARFPVFKRVPLAAGLLLGINLCPPFLAGAAAAAAYGSALKAGIFFGGFFAGSSVYLLPLIFASGLTRFVWLQDTARAFAVLAGFYFIVQGTAIILG